MPALQLDDECPITAHAAKATVLHNFYSMRMGQADPCTPIRNLELLFRDTRLTPSQAVALVVLFSLTELKQILQSVRKDSAPEPDGFTFTLLFFRGNLSLLQDDLLLLLHNFDQEMGDLERINQACLALLPKKKTPF
jgi:hypothetical protein